MRVALLQLTASDDPEQNLVVVREMIRDATKNGADIVCTPEVTNCVSTSRSHQRAVLCQEEDDPTLAGLCDVAKTYETWVFVGSLALKSRDKDGRFANRSFVINAHGEVVARYDKIHMFDVDVSKEETYRESDGYRPGKRAEIAETPFGCFGLSICYDVRFPHLYRSLAKAGAEILLIPAAFSPVTGAAHWRTLLRARAIETGCFVVAAAQTGTHPASCGTSRKTHGHSLVVAPWGEVLADGGVEPGITYVDIDLREVERARRRVPSLSHDRSFEGP